MMPLDPGFRRSLLKYIPQLKGEELDKYDSLLFLYSYRKFRHDLTLFNDMYKEKDDSDRKDVQKYLSEFRIKRKKAADPAKKTYEKAMETISPVRKQYEQVYTQWKARYIIAANQRIGPQPTFHSMFNYIWLGIKYYIIYLYSTFILKSNKWQEYFNNLKIYKVIFILVMIALLLVGFWAILS